MHVIKTSIELCAGISLHHIVTSMHSIWILWWQVSDQSWQWYRREASPAPTSLLLCYWYWVFVIVVLMRAGQWSKLTGDAEESKYLFHTDDIALLSLRYCYCCIVIVVMWAGRQFKLMGVMQKRANISSPPTPLLLCYCYCVIVIEQVCDQS